MLSRYSSCIALAPLAFWAFQVWLHGQIVNKRFEELRGLANPVERPAALDAVRRMGGDATPILLTWSKATPEGMDSHQLKVGLAEAFGGLRAPEAIPFLAENLLLSRTVNGNHWLKAEYVIERRLPSVGALIAIGPRAAEYLIGRMQLFTDPEERARAVFVIARVADDPSEPFLRATATSGSSLERRYALRGLARIASQGGPRPR